MDYDAQVCNVAGTGTGLGSAGPFTLVVDRPAEAGGGGLGFNGGQLLHLAVAGCISNDLFRAAAARGIGLDRVVVRASGTYGGDPAASTGIRYTVELTSPAAPDELHALVQDVDARAAIPNSLRFGTPVELAGISVEPGGPPAGG